MPHIRVWIHFVWSTKNRKHQLIDGARHKIFEHIKSNAAEKGIYMDCVNGYTDHVHCLISLKFDQTISKVMQLIKGESAFWANKHGLLPAYIRKLEWQDEYYAVSVSESSVQAVREYIWNQEEHHRKGTFNNELDEFIEKYGFKKFG